MTAASATQTAAEPAKKAGALAPDGLMPAEAAADENVVGIDAFAAHFGFDAETADIAHVMLGTGVGTSREMNVDGLVELA
jgi:hypothetical protein